MGTGMKGIYKGFKCSLSQMFVKEREIEIEIGLPTDVKHVSHIGWDGATGSAPSWMKEFDTGPDFATTSIDNTASALSSWSSQDFGESMREQLGTDVITPGSEMFTPRTDLNPAKKRQKRKKTKTISSSPKSNTGSTSSRSSRAAGKTKLVEGRDANPTNIEVI